MQIKIEINESELKRLIIKHLEDTLGEVSYDPNCLKIQVKSEQNYKSEWECASFKATYVTNTV